MEVVIPLLFVVGAIVAGILGWRASQKRQAELLAWATERGWDFDVGRDGSFENRYPFFSCLRQGANRYAYNVIRGSHEGRTVCCFDYHYETYTHTKHGRQTHHHHFSVACLETELPLRPLFLRPESVFDKMTEFFGMDDIDFESAQFSREFYVKAKDRKWAFDVIHQRTMEFLLTAPRFRLEMSGPYVIAWRGSRMKAADFQAALGVADGILDRLPPYVIQELKGSQA